MAQSQQQALLAQCIAAGITAEMLSAYRQSGSPQQQVGPITEVRESAEQFASGSDLFSRWYFGQEAVTELVSAIDNIRSTDNPQNYAFIGLVQVTMMGR